MVDNPNTPPDKTPPKEESPQRVDPTQGKPRVQSPLQTPGFVKNLQAPTLSAAPKPTRIPISAAIASPAPATNQVTTMQPNNTQRQPSRSSSSDYNFPQPNAIQSFFGMLKRNWVKATLLTGVVTTGVLIEANPKHHDTTASVPPIPNNTIVASATNAVAASTNSATASTNSVAANNATNTPAAGDSAGNAVTNAPVVQTPGISTNNTAILTYGKDDLAVFAAQAATYVSEKGMLPTWNGQGVTATAEQLAVAKDSDTILKVLKLSEKTDNNFVFARFIDSTTGQSGLLYGEADSKGNVTFDHIAKFSAHNFKATADTPQNTFNALLEFVSEKGTVDVTTLHRGHEITIPAGVLEGSDKAFVHLPDTLTKQIRTEASFAPTFSKADLPEGFKSTNIGGATIVTAPASMSFTDIASAAASKGKSSNSIG